MKKALGIVCYKGPSLIDNEPIVAIATGIGRKSKNEKTGDMIQVWIIRSDTDPITAHVEGDDVSVCGDCKHRIMGSCYVNLIHGPRQVYLAYKAGSYEDAKPEHLDYFRDRFLRIGAYGDPAAVPTFIWETLCGVAKHWTGYTHQWKDRSIDPELRNYCMASCDTEVEVREALAVNWTPFYARQVHAPIPVGGFVCPASKEAGKRLTCEQCRACRGGEHNGIKGYPVIIVHGAPMRQAIFRKHITRYIKLGVRRENRRKRKEMVTA